MSDVVFYFYWKDWEPRLSKRNTVEIPPIFGFNEPREISFAKDPDETTQIWASTKNSQMMFFIQKKIKKTLSKNCLSKKKNLQTGKISKWWLER